MPARRFDDRFVPPAFAAGGEADLAPLVKDARSKEYATRLAAYDALIARGPEGCAALEPVLREAEARAAREFLETATSAKAASFRRWLKQELETELSPTEKIEAMTWSKPGSAQAAAPSKAERRAEAKARGYEGEMCGECGNFTLVRNGTCMKCDTCGGTTGCS